MKGVTTKTYENYLLFPVPTEHKAPTIDLQAKKNTGVVLSASETRRSRQNICISTLQNKPLLGERATPKQIVPLIPAWSHFRNLKQKYNGISPLIFCWASVIFGVKKWFVTL